MSYGIDAAWRAAFHEARLEAYQSRLRQIDEELRLLDNLEAAHRELRELSERLDDLTP